MAKIIGVRIRQDEEYVKEGKDKIVINKLELRCTTKDTASNCIGLNVAKYTIEIKDIGSIFDIKDIPGMEEFANSIIDRECFFETRARSGYNGSVSDEVVRVVFLDDLIKANTKSASSK